MSLKLPTKKRLIDSTKFSRKLRIAKRCRLQVKDLNELLKLNQANYSTQVVENGKRVVCRGCYAGVRLVAEGILKALG